MESVGWTVHLFAIEVGARGYCAATTSSCLVRLGFPPKTKRALLKHLGSIASPKIILPPSHVPYIASKASPSEERSLYANPSRDTSKESAVILERSKYFRKPPPLVNLGNTCYLNAILRKKS